MLCDITNQGNSGLSYKVVHKLLTEAFVHSTEMYKLNDQQEDSFWFVTSQNRTLAVCLVEKFYANQMTGNAQQCL